MDGKQRKPAMTKKKVKRREWKAWAVVPLKITYMTPSYFSYKIDADECASACGDGFRVIKVVIKECV